MTVSFDDDWAQDATHKEPSARERELQARRQRWADLDRAELQGTTAAKRARQAHRSDRWRKTWPWLLFFAVAAVLIGGSRLLGLG
jgi:predicted acyl esterase